MREYQHLPIREIIVEPWQKKTDGFPSVPPVARQANSAEAAEFTLASQLIAASALVCKLVLQPHTGATSSGRSAMGQDDLTDDEKRAIGALKRLAREWPKTLWLYSASGSLNVMRCNSAGKHAVLDQDGGVDPAYSLTVIDIPNDGGDW